MNNICIVAIIIIIFIIWTFCGKNKMYENYVDRYGSPCSVCSDQSYAKCLNCTNCGYCLNANGGKCIRGDVHGPYDKNVKCVSWIGNDPFSEIWWNEHHRRHRLTPTACSGSGFGQ